MQAKVVDLFCGVGGLTKGLKNVGLDVVAGIDLDPTCKFAYETNNNTQFLERNISEVKSSEINNFYGSEELKVLVGCAPCQPFSTMRKKMGDEYNQNDDKYDLLLQFGRLVNETLPDIVSMENVPAIRKSTVFPKFLDILKTHNYKVDYKVVYCPDYGIAQNRRRFVLVASRLGIIKLIEPTDDRKTVTVRKYIFNLPKIGSGEICKTDPMHRTAKLSPLNIKRIQASKPGGSWRDWSSDLLLDCHKKESGQTFTSVYGRMSWDKIGPTMTTQFYCYGTGRYGHPEQDRALTLREGALLQTFPIDYQFIDPTKELFSIKDIARHIGNAVPVRLGEIIGESIKEHIDYVKAKKET
ncbi:MAG: DNA cytosine methyltransferase [Firmicutes bacterium]|nr:DNA cytosine methyltransferase [Bacillota bacterium]